MSTSAVDSVTGTYQSSPDRGMNSLKSEDFFRILVSELQNQDPFEPAKTADMVSQVSQIRSIELSKNLTDTLDTFSQRQQTTGIAELLGKYVMAVQTLEDGTQTQVGGIVTGVRVASDGSAVLELDTGQTVLASDVQYVTSLELIEALQANMSADESKSASEKTQRAQGSPSAENVEPASNGGALAWLGRLFGLQGG